VLARRFLELVRFSHTVFALPFALLAAIMAWWLNAHEQPPVPFQAKQLVGILWCMVTARSAAMAFNRIVDRRTDAANPRTSGRHLPTGQLSLTAVVLFVVLCSAGFVAGTLLFLPENRLPLFLAVPVLLFLFGYSYTKRFTVLAHFWLGTALMMAPVSAWIAIRGGVVLTDPTDIMPALVLGAGVMFWVAGFDIIYSCQDAAFDRSAGLKSMPAWLGVGRALRMSAGCHLASIVTLAILPWVFPGLGWWYLAGLAGIAALLVYEHSIVRPGDLSRVNVAFFNINAMISLGLLAVGTIDLLF
jgi:4-hydroxybenzoate polyprenyltransferase